jgi:hypothetical protein
MAGEVGRAAGDSDYPMTRSGSGFLPARRRRGRVMRGRSPGPAPALPAPRFWFGAPVARSSRQLACAWYDECSKEMITIWTISLWLNIPSEVAIK